MASPAEAPGHMECRVHDGARRPVAAGAANSRHSDAVWPSPRRLTLLGCTGSCRQTRAGAGALPSLAVGNSYSFDDGRIERVAGTAPGAVRWRGQDGFVFTTTENVLLPRIAWSDSEARGERTMSVASDCAVPAGAGNTVAFQASRRTVEGQAARPTEVAESWQCRVDGTARVATKAGDFDTFRVSCSFDHGAAARDADTHILLRTRHRLLCTPGRSNRHG